MKSTSTESARWEHFPHEADMGVRGIGATAAQAFEQAALAMTAIITDPATVAASEAVAVHCEAPDDELLLVDWLNCIVYEMATRHMLFSRFEVKIANGRLEGQLYGEVLDPARHQPAVEVKGATYTGLRVREEPGGVWVAECIVDV